MAVAIKTIIPQIVDQMPDEWRGTTFNNSNLLGREQFCKNVLDLAASGISPSDAGEQITTEALTKLGNAEDYLRVSTNISTVLELVLAQDMGLNVRNVFTFASNTMGVVGIAKTTGKVVNVYGPQSLFTNEQLETLALMGCHITCLPGLPVESTDAINICVSSVFGQAKRDLVDVVIDQNTLYIFNEKKVNPNEILVIRKRMATPITTPMAEQKLQDLGGLKVTANQTVADPAQVKEFLAHLQTLSGTDVDAEAPPVCFTAGLSAISSLWAALISKGGADVLMASTAYGGSSQLVDLYSSSNSSQEPRIRKHKFHIQGTSEILQSIKSSLASMAQDKGKLFPTTVLFLEIPTNPDMKVPDVQELAMALADYEKLTGVSVLLLVDATFAPGSQIMLKLKSLLPNLNVMVFLSMSKSVSRGKTTAGSLVANHTIASKQLLATVDKIASMLDTKATPDQMLSLVQNHVGVEDRCLKAYQVARDAGNVLVESVKAHTGELMALAFVKPEQADLGFTTSTFSFNLPAPKNSTYEENEKLAQKFTDLLCEHKWFKPCVSFGQDNALVYCTVPATSTQGAISEEDKKKQAVGGVQLVRLSFPPTIDQANVHKVIQASVAAIYSKN